jgi:hypothetical protein
LSENLQNYAGNKKALKSYWRILSQWKCAVVKNSTIKIALLLFIKLWELLELSVSNFNKFHANFWIPEHPNLILRFHTFRQLRKAIFINKFFFHWTSFFVHSTFVFQLKILISRFYPAIKRETNRETCT